MKHTEEGASLSPEPRRSAERNDLLTVSDTVTGVRLQDGSVALIDRRDFEALQAAGHTGRWFLNLSGQGNPYVRLQGRSNLLTVARLILGARPEEQVEYRNGSRLDLRRENLTLRLRKGGKRRDAIEAAQDLYPHSPELQAAYLRGRWQALRERSKTVREAPAILRSAEARV
ncbi:hypothetical protein [Piscinibacterium candidicorallinum]|uniref:Uncharacterized protein n=1 Tax=Piscinibacterium candidicorallinum TaxID=1793872 RepID=A0ABV7H8Q3_9BURK